MGQDGNEYWNMLQVPCLKRLVPLKPGLKALDLATGNGLVARWLAAGGADVTATDGSEKMLEHATRRANEGGLRMEFRKLDVTQPQDFEDLLASSAGSAVSVPKLELGAEERGRVRWVEWQELSSCHLGLIHLTPGWRLRHRHNQHGPHGHSGAGSVGPCTTKALEEGWNVRNTHPTR